MKKVDVQIPNSLNEAKESGLKLIKGLDGIFKKMAVEAADKLDAMLEKGKKVSEEKEVK